MSWFKKGLVSILLVFALIGIFSIYKYWVDFGSNREVEATILLERVEKVMKLVTVEGSFSEIYNYDDHLIANIWPFRKKALVRVNAKVLVGYDFEKLIILADHDKKILRIGNIPDPEILSIEHDMDYYNFENGLFNMITNEDITEMGFEAKEFIAEKARESDLYLRAEEQRKDLFEVLKLAIEASGWKLIDADATPMLKN